MNYRKTLLATALLLLVAACATSPTGRKQLMLVSEDTAIKSSRQAYAQEMGKYQKEGKLVSDPRVLERVRTITERLVAQAVKARPDSAKWQWSVQVIDEPKTVNAWCMAGGRMAIYTGLILKVDPTDDELAQVMGHEIAHALANHTAERMSTAMAANAGIIAAGLMSDKPGQAMALAAAAATVAVKLPNSRASENEADQIGIELAAKAGYDPRAAATLWQKMGKVGGGAPPEFLSTHPSDTTRQERLGALAPKMMQYYQPQGSHPTYPVRMGAAGV
ncbi:MAG: M48 family metallopeptidase [Gammaproteobacteria bacterium]|jgi:predicted Zn-dependent protease|nr:M48 family metallopeptidase [Gammaproteobacteria bacterium]MDH5175218.1 M48 family metallopeptidase [Gammaproteobacteria bacterium]MDH5225953.1 M48 family metallopeptidase [Gammaproteobacteria bacterium]